MQKSIIISTHANGMSEELGTRAGLASLAAFP